MHHIPGHWKAALVIASLIFVLSARGMYRQPKITTPPDCRQEVRLRVSVFDPLNRSVSGLERQHFRVSENNLEQVITHFAHRSASLCMGVVYDMRRKSSVGAELPVLAARRVFMSAGPEEEFFFLSFDTKQGGLVNWVRGTSEAARAFDLGQVAGMTPLDEAVHTGVVRIRESSGQKKALVVISEAPDPDIRLALGAQDLTSLSGFQVYVIEPTPSRTSAPTSADSRVPGGTYVINDLAEVEYYLGLVYAELQNQYVIGYVPSRGSCDGQWRKISIRLNPPKEMPRLRVKAPHGYNAPPARS
jgi:hypothetical protein